uniref:Uncharacterized protein n=1 Tax=Panagrolaimus davidi TaxID=227884 RepID=A0A914QEB6_9BILA
MSTSSYISLTSISAISGGAAYLTFFPRNNLSSWNILGRKIAIGVMVSGAIGWIIYWSFNKKPLIKKKKVLPKLTTIRKRRTSKTSSSPSASSSASASSKPSASTSSSSSGTAKTNNDFISSPTNVSMTGASTKSKSPTMASTQQKSVTKVESNDTISKIVENKIDEKLLPKLAEKSELLPSAPSTFLPTQEIIVPKTEASAKIAENESVQLPSNKNVEEPSKIATAQETSVIKAVEATPKIEPPKTLDKKIEEPSLIASAPAPETTAAKVESVEPSKDLQKIESYKVPEKQQIENLL